MYPINNLKAQFVKIQRLESFLFFWDNTRFKAQNSAISSKYFWLATTVSVSKL